MLQIFQRLTRKGIIMSSRSNNNSNGVHTLPNHNSTLTPTQIMHFPWFHGKISRDEAERLLLPSFKHEGTFLIRESTNFPGDYTLCVVFQGKVEHYHILMRNDQFTVDEEETFPDLDRLVVHYQNDADGLCTQLTMPLVKKVVKTEPSLDSKDLEGAVWVIPSSDLQLGDTIGKGEFGDVVLGYLRGGSKVAVKTLKDPHAVQSFLAEANVMASLRHPHLVQLLGVVLDGPSISLVTEYMGKGNLVEFLRSRGRQHLTRKDQLYFSRDCCAGMAHLEAKKVVHRDLAARNVLLSDEMVAKVCDFGLARDYTSITEGGKLPIKWTAPEALKFNRFSNKSDMWSFGILLWEIYSFGRVPYPRVPLGDVVKFIEKGYRMEAPDSCPAEIYELIRAAWEAVPENRPTFSEVLVRLESLTGECV